MQVVGWLHPLTSLVWPPLHLSSLAEGRALGLSSLKQSCPPPSCRRALVPPTFSSHQPRPQLPGIQKLLLSQAAPASGRNSRQIAKILSNLS